MPALSGHAEGTALFVALATLPPTSGDDGEGAAPDAPPLSASARLLTADASSAVVRWTADGYVTRIAFAPDAVEVTTSHEAAP